MSQEDQVEPSGPRPIADDPTTHGRHLPSGLLGLGSSPVTSALPPFGDAHQAYWDEGSAAAGCARRLFPNGRRQCIMAPAPSRRLL